MTCSRDDHFYTSLVILRNYNDLFSFSLHVLLMVLISFMTLKAFAFAILMKNIKSEKESQLLGTDTKKKKKQVSPL